LGGRRGKGVKTEQKGKRENEKIPIYPEHEGEKECE
jgi:hypothetical protein